MLALRALVAAIVLGAVAGSAPAGEPARPFATRIIQSGHSLTDPIVPMLAELVLQMGGPRNPPIARSTTPGSPMDWRWTHPVGGGMPDARRDIADYDLLVLTERVSLSGTVPWHDSEVMALRWAEHAWREGRGGLGAETILYASWVAVTSGPDYDNPHNDPEGAVPFRERLPLEMARWERILARMNDGLPPAAPRVQMIPGPMIMAAVFDAVAAGAAPGLNSMRDLFHDDIHVNETGAYLIALAHYAVIYGRDPRDLPDGLGRVGRIDPATAAWMQALVWRTLDAYRSAR